MNIAMTSAEDVAVFRFNGFLNYESISKVRALFLGAKSNELNQRHKKVFNLADLSFVGSIGITDFVEVLLEVNKLSPAGVALCGVSSEFQRIIAAKNPSIAFFQSETQAVQSYKVIASPHQFLENEDLLGSIASSESIIPAGTGKKLG